MSNIIPMAESRAVYTVDEVAHLLSLSRSGTYALVQSGEIPAKRIGGRWVIPKVRFHRWIEELPEATPEEIDAEFQEGNA